MKILDLIADLISGRIHNTLFELNNRLKAQEALIKQMENTVMSNDEKMTDNEKKITQATAVISAMVTAFSSFKITMEEKVETLQEQAEDGESHTPEDLSQEFENLQTVLDEGQRFVDAITSMEDTGTTPPLPTNASSQDPVSLAGPTGITDAAASTGSQIPSESAIYPSDTDPAEFPASEPHTEAGESTLPIEADTDAEPNLEDSFAASREDSNRG